MSAAISNPAKDLLTSASDAMSALSSLYYGSFSGGYDGHKREDCDGVSLALLLTSFASIGVVFFAVFTKLTMIIGKRKKRSVSDDEGSEDSVSLTSVLDNLHLIVYEGIGLY